MKKISLAASIIAVVVAFWANAATVTLDQAKAAARAWAKGGVALEAHFGSTVSTAVTHTNAAGEKYHEVKFYGGGTLYLSDDTESEPVIAFTSESNPDLSEGSPLRDLLERDAKIRAACRVKSAIMTTAAATPGTAATSSAAPQTANAALWAKLISVGQGTTVKTTTAAAGKMTTAAASAADPLESISDVRVAPLLKTKWSQSTAKSKNCYNYYTPGNSVCGCTATALAQIMNYWQFPTAEVTPKEFACTYNDEATNITTKGGVYAWDKMVAVPANGITDEGCEAIGRLCFDAGVSIGSSYSKGSTGAYAHNVPNAMRNYFGFKSGFDFTLNGIVDDNGVLGTEAFRAKVIYTNLDAKRPVQLGIYASVGGGHSVVADGYGFHKVNGKRTSFVHINMGWAGQDDMWYNLPEVNTSLTPTGTSGDTNYDLLHDVVFNVSTNSSGFELISGHLVNDDGENVANAMVKLTDSDGEVYEIKSDAKGVFAAEVKGGKSYSVYAEQGLYFYQSETSTSVGITKATEGAEEVYDKYVIANEPENVGNRYLGELEMILPAARIIVDGEGEEKITNVFSRLDKALAAATNDNNRIEILQPIELRNSFIITNNILLVATNELAGVTPIQPADGARLLVSNQLTLANVAFEGATGPVIEVIDDLGKLIIDGVVDFGVNPLEAAAIKTRVGDNLEINNVDFTSFAVDCAAATEVGKQFGLSSLDGLDASVIAALTRIVNAYDNDRELRAILTAGELKWETIPVPYTESIAYFVTTNGISNCYARIDRALDQLEVAMANGDFGECVPAVVLRKDCVLTRPLTVTNDIVLDAEVPVTITAASTAGFTIGENGWLTVKGLQFADYKGNALFYVNGGRLAMSDVTLTNLEGTNRYSGAIAVMNGAAAMTNCTITGCRATGKYAENYTAKQARGGAIYLNGANTEVEIIDSTITDCWANYLGGGVYAGKSAKVAIGGNLKVRNNSHATGNVEDGLFLNALEVSLKVVKPLCGEKVVSVRYSTNCLATGNGDGFAFADVSQIADDSDGVSHTIDAFYNAVNPEYGVVESTKQPEMLAWSAADVFHRVNPGEGCCKLEGCGSDRDGEYDSLKHAFEAITNSAEVATITMLKPACTNMAGIVVNGLVTLRSTNEAVSIYRGYNASITIGESAALVITNLVLADVAATTNTTPMLLVTGGSLTLDNGAALRDVNGKGRNATAVSVWNGGTLTMKDGAEIANCRNLYYENDTTASFGGGIVSDNGIINLLGGVIRDCYAYRGGAIFAGSKSVIRFSGDFVATNNKDGYRGSALTSNLYVSDNSVVELAGVYDGDVGVIAGERCDTNVFGTVTAGFADLTTLTNSAARFHNDITGGYGVPITNAEATVTQLVWSTSIDAEGKFVGEDGVSYYPFAPVLSAPLLPSGIAFKSIVVDSLLGTCTVTLTNLVRGCHYTIYTNGVLLAEFPEEWTPVDGEFTAEESGPYELTVPYNGDPIYFGATAR